MKNKIILLILFATLSCNPCKYVSKHQECFPADTIKIDNQTIHYEKIYITEDSIIVDTVPCPANDTILVPKKIYKTIWKTKIDTIYKSIEKSKVNPLNEALKDDNDRMAKKIERRKIFIWYSIGITLLIIIYLVIKFYLKKLKF